MSRYDSLWTEKEQEMNARTLWDDIYRSIYPLANTRRVSEASSELDKMLDTEAHIDLHLILETGEEISAQEKALSYEFNGFNTITIEFFNNYPNKWDLGDYFLCKAQIYCCGYLNYDNTGFCKWWIIDMIKLREVILDNGGIAWVIKFWKKNVGNKNADFLALPVGYIWDAVIHGYDNKKPLIHPYYEALNNKDIPEDILCQVVEMAKRQQCILA